MLEKILTDLGIAGGTPYYVGGYVRDMKLGVPCKDVDIEVHGLPVKRFLKTLQKHGPVDLLGESFGVWKIKGLDYDFSLPRKDRSTGPGHKDFQSSIDIELGIEEALRRRDFTINAMAIEALSGKLIDPFGGLEDLKLRVLKVVDPETFVEDPLRVLRGAQFCARMGLSAPKETIRLCKRLWEYYDTLPSERVFEELKKLLLRGQFPSLGIQFLKETGWLKHWPELDDLWGIPQDKGHHPEGDVEFHLLEVIDRAAGLREMIPQEDRLTYMLSCLLHDVGKKTHTFYRTEPKRLHHWEKGVPKKQSRLVAYGHDESGEAPARRFLERITDNREILDRVPRLVKFHMGPLLSRDWKDGAYRKRAKQGCEMWLTGMVSWADKGQRNASWYQHLDRLTLNGPGKTIVQGRHVLARGFEEGPEVGRIVRECEELFVKFGMTDPEQLLDRVLNVGKKKKKRKKDGKYKR